MKAIYKEEERPIKLSQGQARAIILKAPGHYRHILNRLQGKMPHEIYGYPQEEIFFISDGEFFAIKAENSDQVRRLIKHPSLKGEMGLGGDRAMIYETIKSLKKEVWVEPCYLYYYDGKPYPLERGPGGSVLKPLSEADVDEVFEYYPYQEEGKAYVAEIIETMPSLGLWIDNVLASWLLQRPDGSLGFMYTKAAFRKQGLGAYVSKAFINGLLEKEGPGLYLHIFKNNKISQQLATQLGFRKVEAVYWAGFLMT